MRVNIGPYAENPDYVRLVDVKIDSYDTWNLDHTLALIIRPALVQLKKDKSGYPCSPDFNPNCTSWSSDTDRDKCGCEALWNEYLDQMILAFDLIIAEDFIEDADAYEETQSKINAGLMLFGKYFRALWT